MSYLNRGNGYEPTGNINSEPDQDAGIYPAPAAVHPRHLEEQAFGGDLLPEPGDVEHPDTFPGFVEVTGPAPAPQDSEVLARLRKIVGTGPYVIVKLDGPVESLAGAQPVPVTIGWGNGVTEHLADMVLGMGLQALAERRRGQEDTQDIPPVRP